MRHFLLQRGFPIQERERKGEIYKTMISEGSISMLDDPEAEVMPWDDDEDLWNYPADFEEEPPGASDRLRCGYPPLPLHPGRRLAEYVSSPVSALPPMQCISCSVSMSHSAGVAPPQESENWMRSERSWGERSNLMSHHCRRTLSFGLRLI